MERNIFKHRSGNEWHYIWCNIKTFFNYLWDALAVGKKSNRTSWLEVRVAFTEIFDNIYMVFAHRFIKQHRYNTIYLPAPFGYYEPFERIGLVILTETAAFWKRNGGDGEGWFFDVEDDGSKTFTDDDRARAGRAFQRAAELYDKYQPFIETGVEMDDIHEYANVAEHHVNRLRKEIQKLQEKHYLSPSLRNFPKDKARDKAYVEEWLVKEHKTFMDGYGVYMGDLKEIIIDVLKYIEYMWD